MKILISTDIEGIAGVNGRIFLDETSQEYLTACKLLTDEVNVVISACFDNGVSKIVVADGHGSGNNILVDQLDSRVEVHIGKRGDFSMVEGVQEVDYMIMVGYHGKANVAGSYCSHTNSTKTISKVEINGVECGEAQINALVAKSFGVKTILLIGTDFAVSEIKENVPNMVTVATKNSLAQYSCDLRNVNEVYDEIRLKVKDAISEKENIPFIDLDVENAEWRVSVPYVFLLENLDHSIYERIDSKTVKIPFQNIVEGFFKYRKLLKFLSKNLH